MRCGRDTVYVVLVVVGFFYAGRRSRRIFEAFPVHSLGVEPTATPALAGSVAPVLNLPNGTNITAGGVQFTAAIGTSIISFKSLGCYRRNIADTALYHRGEVNRGTNTPLMCARACVARDYLYFGLKAKHQCWCSNSLPSELHTGLRSHKDDPSCTLRCPGDSSQTCGGGQAIHLYQRLKGKEPNQAIANPVITFYVEPARTRNSLFLSGRFARYATGKYTYKTVVLTSRLARNVKAFRTETCVTTPGFKVFVGHGELVLRNWPGNAIWSVTGDENGDWGLKRHGKYYGLHGPGGLFPTNESTPHGSIIIPPHAKPWFRQYYDVRQVDAFGESVRFWPLGSRIEFPDIDSETLILASRRTYTYSYMVAITDATRRRLLNITKMDKLIPTEKRYVHVSENWHASAGHADYVSPVVYAKTMQTSVFVLCPKGHSVEQFRIYEAMEAGAIPVLERHGDYLKSKLPPEYFESGMLFVERWEDAPKEMAKLSAIPSDLDRRQEKVMQWYKEFMIGKAREIETTLEGNPDPMRGSVCKNME